MISEKYYNRSGCPFDHYHTHIGEFIDAQNYWSDVIRSVEGWESSHWTPIEIPPGMEDHAQLNGEVLKLRHKTEPKIIELQTSSIPGSAAVILDCNGSVSAEQAVTFGGEPTPGMTKDEALEVARSESPFLRVWVEPGIWWSPDPTHPEGGCEVQIERLVITSEVREDFEPRVQQAVREFIEPGPAEGRVQFYE